MKTHPPVFSCDIPGGRFRRQIPQQGISSAIAVAVLEPGRHLGDFCLELIRLVELVGEGGEGKVKVVIDTALLQSWRFRQARPDFAEVLHQSIAQILEWCGS